MAISKDGAFGAGRILLTTFLPREIAGSLGVGEAMGFIENIVLFADHTNLYLEYGPAAPLGNPVSIAVRQSWLWDETLGQVPVRLEDPDLPGQASPPSTRPVASGRSLRRPNPVGCLL